MKRPFTIYDLPVLRSSTAEGGRFTICGKSAKSAIVTPNSELRTPNSQKGVALIITLILLAVVTFMALTFLAVSRRERGAVTTTTDTASARLAADAALAAAEGEIVANTLATTNPYNFGLIVSTNYINPVGYLTAVGANSTNVNYFYPNGQPVSGNDLLQNLANLYYLPRAPVLISTNDPVQGRFYLDLNRNGYFETNGLVADESGTNFEVGDPEWIGVLQHPDQPYGPNNPFVARYSFIALPIGNALDLNAIYNQAVTKQVNSSLGTVNDGFLRNQGVGSWEINLAAFFTDLNDNQWDPIANPYKYLRPGFPNTGAGFDDALALLSYRYGYNYNLLATADQLFANAANVFPFDNIDGYSDGPLQTIFNTNEISLPDDPSLAWAGADNTNQFFDLQELFNPNESSVAFTNRLLSAGDTFNPGNNDPTNFYNRYTYYRLASQLGVESAPEQNKMNLNYDNLDPGLNGVLNANGTASATNFVPWTALGFFTNAADRMLRDYTTEWRNSNPTNFATTFYAVPNFNFTNADLWTNYPAFGLNGAPGVIPGIPVWVSNQFVYTPAVQRVLQLAANIYDATTNNATQTTPDYPSVFRPIFFVTYNPVSGYTNVYITGYEPVETLVGGAEQIGVVTGPGDFQFSLPVKITDLLNPNPPFSFGPGIYTNVNVYGVPWIIGAKKGFPNFNEFAMESAFQLTRKLQVTRQNTNDTYVNNPGDYSYNQMFNLSLTNQLAVECWNSYTNFYQYPAGMPRKVAIYVEDNLSVTLTNDEFPLNNYFSYTTNFLITNSLQIPNPDLTAWPGYNPTVYPLSTPASFQIPLNVNVPVIPTSMYRFNIGGTPYLTTNLELPFETGVTFNNSQLYPQPHWWLMTTNNVQVIILDTTGPNPQVIDYVQLSGPESVRDLSFEIMTNYDVPFNTTQASGSELWNTNIQNGVPIGIVSQIAVSDGNAPASSAGGTWDTTDPTQLANEIAGFTAFMGYTPTPPLTADELNAIALAQTSLSNNAPYQPVATMIQVADWQVNDPLVHYLAEDIDQPGVETSFRAPIPPALAPTLTNSTYATIGQLNARCMWWGRVNNINTPDFMTLNAYNLALKDPLVSRSDDWDFPTYQLPTIGWLGRVHRGTPWQTVYLKSPNILSLANGLTTWTNWTGNTNSFDAINTAPVQDRLLFDNFTTAFNDNATRGQLSVNVGASDPNNPQAGLAAWSALLSGVEVLSNNAADPAVNTAIGNPAQHNGSLTNYTAFPINPAGPAGANSAVGQIVAGVNQTRTNFYSVDGLQGVFEHVGDILSVPQLSDQSPLLHLSNYVNNAWVDDPVQKENGISDEMYEWLPQQAMSLLRVSGTPQSPMRYVIYSYGQTLKPAPNGIYTGGGSLFGMIANYQVVAESATRSVLQFNNTRVSNVVWTNNSAGVTNWVAVPSITNSNAQIERFNVLPPN